MSSRKNLRQIGFLLLVGLYLFITRISLTVRPQGSTAAGSPRLSGWLTEVVKAQRRRQQLLNDTCTWHPWPHLVVTHKNLSYFVVDDARKIIYCWMPKVACSNWKLLLVSSSPANISQQELDTMNRKFVKHHNARFKATYGINPNLTLRQLDFIHHSDTLGRAGLTYMDTLSDERVKHRLGRYFTFLFVRDPFTRLYSAWKDKYTRDDISGYRRKWGPNIIRKYRKNTTTLHGRDNVTIGNGTTQQKSIDVTFYEFLRFVVDNQHQPDLHWEPQHKLACACYVKFHFIGKFETLKQDSEYVWRQISRGYSNKGGRGILRSPRDVGPSHWGQRSTTPGKHRRERKRLRETLDPYQDIPEKVVRDIRKVYAMDFEMFGYDPFRVKGKAAEV